MFSANGFGLVVVGGKLGQDDKLGAYVIHVTAGGAADRAGISVGTSFN